VARVSKKRGERSGARSGLGSGRAGERMSTVLSGSAQPGAAAGLYSHSSQPYIQRLGIAGVSIQRLQAVPTPCRPLERAVPVPCQRAGIAAQARARGRAVLGTGTGEAGRAVFVPGQISIVPVLARWAWPVWKSLHATGDPIHLPPSSPPNQPRWRRLVRRRPSAVSERRKPPPRPRAARHASRAGTARVDRPRTPRTRVQPPALAAAAAVAVARLTVLSS